MPWDPDRYHQFQAERSAPFVDLMALVECRAGMRVVDLGCGTGELTARLAAALSDGQVTGIDRSPEMLSRAAQHTGPNLSFELGDIESAGGAWDLVFSNAALQWVEDHRALIPRLYAMVRPGGQLAFQVPSNYGHPSQTLIVKVAGEQPFRDALGGWYRASPVLAIDAYAQSLFEQGASCIVACEKVYPHVLADADAIADWTSGTALVPYQERLPADLREPFMQRYRQLLRELWPTGPVFYPFRRTLVAAQRPAAV